MLTNVLTVSRFFDDLPPIASDQELLEWADSLLRDPDAEPDVHRVAQGASPLVADRGRDSLSLDELLMEIESRATEVYERAHS